MRKLFVASLSLVALLCVREQAQAVSVTFDNTVTITDNLFGFDFDPTIGIIQFDSTKSGALTKSGYEVKGEVTTKAAGTTLAMANATSILTLTNFVADTGTALPGQSVVIDFVETFTATGIVNGVAAIDAQVANGNGQALFANGATSNAVGPGTDVINDWYGYISGAIINAPTSGGPPPLLNPNLPAGGGTANYSVYTQGPQPFGVFAPVVGAHLDFTLGAPRDQLLLPSSAQVGFWVVPEPSSYLLLALGGVALTIARRRANR